MFFSLLLPFVFSLLLINFRKFHTVIVDDEISLSDDYVNKMRSNYEDRMRIEREKVEKINKDKADAARATDIIFGVPDNSEFFASLLVLLKAFVDSPASFQFSILFLEIGGWKLSLSVLFLSGVVKLWVRFSFSLWSYFSFVCFFF